MFGRDFRGSKNKYDQRERDRIRKDEENNDRIAELDRIKSLILKAEFEDSADEKSLSRRKMIQQREMELWKTSLTLARREALRRFLEEERQLHIRELNNIGLTIYQQRT
ncbi:hypothetical protein IRJ41_013221 [Triplophysa rosa]|uniref:Uncharacterized protein n=1 Tax=Triplophysa rosa TaxID=992332 RepID=A0A9W8C488_TRIRA|nr:hypothetical protein IRJ41_013221 [Triplophysa rosa]